MKNRQILTKTARNLFKGGVAVPFFFQGKQQLLTAAQLVSNPFKYIGGGLDHLYNNPEQFKTETKKEFVMLDLNSMKRGKAFEGIYKSQKQDTEKIAKLRATLKPKSKRGRPTKGK